MFSTASPSYSLDYNKAKLSVVCQSSQNTEAYDILICWLEIPFPHLLQFLDFRRSFVLQKTFPVFPSKALHHSSLLLKPSVWMYFCPDTQGRDDVSPVMNKLLGRWIILGWLSRHTIFPVEHLQFCNVFGIT